MHILITAKAKLGQLYQCTPLIVGDKYADIETMSFLGAKLTRDFPDPSGPPVYVLSASPLAVMDALQERGFELKLSTTVDGYISWLMSKPMDKYDESSDENPQRELSPTEPRNNDSSRVQPEKQTTPPKTINYGPCATSTPIHSSPSRHRIINTLNESKNIATQTRLTQSEWSQWFEWTNDRTDKSERHDKSGGHQEKVQLAKSRSDMSHPEKSDASQTEPPEMSPVKKETKPKQKTMGAPSSESEQTPPPTDSSDSSVTAPKAKKDVKRTESPSKKKKKQSTVSVRKEETPKKDRKSAKPE